MSVRPNRRPAAGPAWSRRRVLGGAAATGLLVPAASLLGACASAGDSDSNGTDEGERTDDNPFGLVPDSQVDAVFFAGGFGTEYPDALKELFEARWPEAEVGVTTTTTIATETQPRFAAGNPPDFLNNSGDNELALDGLVNDGAIIPLDELLAAPSIDDPSRTVGETLVPGVFEAGEFNGQLYAFNYVNSAYGWWYDAKLFRDNGWSPPTTWSEFLALADELLAAGIAPFIYAGDNGLWYMQNVFMEWVNLEGGHEAVVALDNLEPDAWRQPAVRTAAERLTEMVESGLVYPGSEGLFHITAQQLWLDRQAAFLWCGTWLEGEMSDPDALGEVDAAGIPDDFEMTMFAPPAPSDNPGLPVGSLRTQPGEPFLVPADAANRAGGLELLRVMCTQEFGNRFSELTNSATVVQGTGQNIESIALRSAAAASSAAPDNILWRWQGWYSAPMYEDVFEPMIGELMAGRATPDELIDAMQDAADRVAADDSIEKQRRTV